MNGYRKLIVWQKAVDLVIIVYKETGKFPKEEIYGLTSQMRRSVVSIPSNIAEGRMRHPEKEFRNFLHIAYGSGAELETQIEIAKRLFSDKSLDFKKIEGTLSEVMKMLNALIVNLKV